MWQSPPSMAVENLTTTATASNGSYEQRAPLRQRMLSNQPIKEQTEPVVDMKYLQMNSSGNTQNRTKSLGENDENNFRHKGNVRPFLVSTNIEKE